jgi:hypothetical protein
MSYTVKAMPSERLGQVVAGDCCRGHRQPVRGHVYTGVSVDQHNAYILRFTYTSLLGNKRVYKVPCRSQTSAVLGENDHGGFPAILR